MQPNGDRTHDQSSTERRVTVPEAARILGISPEAVRARLSRGTLPKDKGPDGAVYVILDTDQPGDHTQPNGDRTADESRSNGDRTNDQTGTVEVLQEQIDYLREQLDQERQARTEERRRHDTLMAQLMTRIPEIEAPPEPRHAPEPASEEPGNMSAPSPEKEAENQSSRRSWWQRLFSSPSRD